MALTFADYQESLGTVPGVKDAVQVAAALHVLVFEAFNSISMSYADLSCAGERGGLRDPAQRWALANRITELLNTADPEVLAEAIAADSLTGEPDSRLSVDASHPQWVIQPANFR